MVIIQYTYPFTCKHCNTRSSKTTIDNKCTNCGKDLGNIPYFSQSIGYIPWIVIIGFILILALC